LDRSSADFFGDLKLTGDVINLEKECLKLQKELDEARKEADYYRQMSEESGKKRLREMERLSKLIIERNAAEAERLRFETEYQKAKKIEAIGMLAGGVAHDLNNVLGGIVGYPDLILPKLPPGSPIRNHVMAMKESGRKAAAIVKDMLILARKGIEPKNLINLNSVIEEYLQSPEYEKLMESHAGIFVKTSLSRERLPVLGSSHNLFRVIMNLVSNAAEAMREGGTIWISTRNEYINELTTRFGDVSKGDYAIIEIEDTGVGIAKENLERIFEPFYTKKVLGRNGTGLGMAVVWSSVRDHDGYIDVISAPGEGSIFKLYFPVTCGELLSETGAAPAGYYLGHGETILVVDDVKEQREIASAMLSDMGYSVAAVSSGEEAVERLKKNPVDLIILDMIMESGIDGLDTYKRILDIAPGQKSVIVSGFSETDRLREVLRLSKGVFVKKPYVIQKLGVAVRNVLGNSDRPS
jgi:two-component system, cell cycle sensor histidine kinase and response regulator CckA